MSNPRLFNQLSDEASLNIVRKLSIEEILKLLQTGDKYLIAKMNNGNKLPEIIYTKISDAILQATPTLPYKPNSLAAVSLLKRFPELLFDTNVANVPMIDHTGRAIQQSLYQQALATGDVWLLQDIHKYIFPLLPKAEKDTNQDLAVKQFEIAFPHYHEPILLDSILSQSPDLVFSEEEKSFFELESRYYDKRNVEQIISVKRALIAIFDAITADNCYKGVPNSETQLEIDKLVNALDNNNAIPIQSGLHFPMFILFMATNSVEQQAYAAYHATLQDPEPWDRSNQWAEKCSVYALAVVKLVQKYMTAVDWQCLLNGLEDDIFDRQVGPSRRNEFLRDSNNMPFLAFIQGTKIQERSNNKAIFEFTTKNGDFSEGCFSCGSRDKSASLSDIFDSELLESLCSKKHHLLIDILRIPEPSSQFRL